jgi:GTP cyclohydrolase I
MTIDHGKNKNNGKNHNGYKPVEIRAGSDLLEIENPGNEINSPSLNLSMPPKLVEKEYTDAAVEETVRNMLFLLGEDPEREGLHNTPLRVRKMYGELLSGYDTDPVKLINNALFDVDYDEVVIVRDIELQSMCEHHMLPFLGRAHVAYIPNGKVIGLSKIPRIVDMFARRLQVQERLTTQIADFLEETLHPAGVAVVVEAAHMCAAIRGVRKANSRMITSTYRGDFKTNSDLRREFMDNISRPLSQELY